MDFIDKTELIIALVKAKSEFTEIKKNKVNPFFKSSYADLDEVNNAVDPALSANGLVMMQPVSSEDGKLYVDTYLLHESGQHIESRWEVALDSTAKNRQQNEGAGVTYIRRYAKVAMLGLASEDDDDGNTASRAEQQNAPRGQHRQSSGKSSGADEGRDMKQCFAIASEMGWNENEIADYFRDHCPVVNKEGGDIIFKKVKSRKDFTAENWKLLAAFLDKMRNNKKKSADRDADKQGAEQDIPY